MKMVKSANSLYWKLFTSNLNTTELFIPRQISRKKYSFYHSYIFPLTAQILT